MSSPAPTITEKPVMLASWVCPYVQRAWIAINQKQIPYDVAYIDLKNKPSWFLEVSPHGKVPVVVFKEGDQTRTLHESLVLVEWAADHKQGPALLPEDPTQKALARLIINRYDSKFPGTFYKLMRSGSREEAHEAAAALRAELDWLESQIAGPYILPGEDLSAVDAVVVPWLLRASVLRHYRGFDLFEGRPKLAAYAAAVKDHPAVKDTIKPPTGDWDKDLAEGYAAYGGEPVNYFS